MRRRTVHKTHKTARGHTWKRSNLVNPAKGRELILREIKDAIDKEMRLLSKLSQVSDEDLERITVRDILVEIIKNHNIPTATHQVITESDIQELNDYCARALSEIVS